MGHNAWGCDFKHVVAVEQTEELDEDEEQVDIGTVWNVVAVEKHSAHVGPMDVDPKVGKTGKAAEGEEKSRTNIEIALDSGAGRVVGPRAC